MKKSHLLGTMRALTLFTMISSANAAIIASNDTSMTRMDQSYAQPFAVSSSLFYDGAPTLNVSGNSGQTEPDENIGYFREGTLPVASPHASLWLLLIAGVVAIPLSEIFHRKSFNR